MVTGLDVRGKPFVAHQDEFGVTWYWSEQDQRWGFGNKGDGVNPKPFPANQAEAYQEWFKRHGRNCNEKCLCVVEPFSAK